MRGSLTSNNVANKSSIASVMSAPGSLAIAKIMYPELERSKFEQTVAISKVKDRKHNLFYAILEGLFQYALTWLMMLVREFRSRVTDISNLSPTAIVDFSFLISLVTIIIFRDGR